MVNSAPVHRGNKSSAAALRRKHVMRLLAGCQHQELQQFLNMAFKIFDIDPQGNTVE